MVANHNHSLGANDLIFCFNGIYPTVVLMWVCVCVKVQHCLAEPAL